MPRYSDNYYLRKCYLKSDQVPTQSVMIKKLSPPLAAVYFKTMKRKLKILAGLEPPMEGGGSDWFMPPKDLLEGRAVLKPIKKEHLSNLNYLGTDYYGMQCIHNYEEYKKAEEKRLIDENDKNWKYHIETTCLQYWEVVAEEARHKNTETIKNAFAELSVMYTSSLNKIEHLLFNAAMKKIKSVEQEAYQKMCDRYEILLKQQAKTLYDTYTDKLMTRKTELKAEFIQNVENSRTEMADLLHDINVDKHVAVEKLRQYLECQNLACQVYVALKEREAGNKELELSKHKHKKKVKDLAEQIALREFEIRLAKKKEKSCEEFNRMWKKKICHVVKKFQMFVSFCLNTLPDHSEFFLNMEKLMLLQLNEASENPVAKSIFVPKQEKFSTPVPHPQPFFLFCDKGYKHKVDENLCPKRCTSSTPQLPVIIVNKRCIYAACDNFEKFTDKIKDYIGGRMEQDADFEDHHIYENYVPVKYPSSMQILDMKLESSLQQILQQELPNIKQVPIECCFCKIPHCFCSPLHASPISLELPKESAKRPQQAQVTLGNKIETRVAELNHEREPKWNSYLKYIEPQKCECVKRTKKHLVEHLPPYMRNVSTYAEPEIPNYERCSLTTLKELVAQAKGLRPSLPALPIQSKTRDVSTQYSDQEFDFLCTCFSDEDIKKVFEDLFTNYKLFDERITAPQCRIVGDSQSALDLPGVPSEFAINRAFSLKNMVNDSPELQEIFMKKDCNFD